MTDNDNATFLINQLLDRRQTRPNTKIIGDFTRLGQRHIIISPHKNSFACERHIKQRFFVKFSTLIHAAILPQALLGQLDFDITYRRHVTRAVITIKREV